MTYVPIDVSPVVADIQLRRYRAMSAAEKLACADALWDLALEASKAGVRMRHPDLDEQAVTRMARSILHRASD